MAVTRKCKKINNLVLEMQNGAGQVEDSKAGE